jgi:hypothetical protein
MRLRQHPVRLAAFILVALSAMLLAGCGRTSEPEPGAADSPAATASPAPSGSPAADPSGPALPLGRTATVAGVELTPTAIHPRGGPVYDADGQRIQGRGVQVLISVEKTREPEGAELPIPVAYVIGSGGERVKMDDLFGLPPAQAQSNEFNSRYGDSYQFACLQTPGTVSKAVLWFSIPRGMTADELVIDGGGGQTATWRLD